MPQNIVATSGDEFVFDSHGDAWVFNSWVNVDADSKPPAGMIFEYTLAELASSNSAHLPTPELTISSAMLVDIDSNDRLVFTPTGNLWVENSGKSTMYEYGRGQLSTGGSKDPRVTLSDSLSAPSSLAFDRAGDLWVANEGNSTLVEYAAPQLATRTPVPSRTISTYSTPAAAGGVSACAFPMALAFDPSGDLWVGSPDCLAEYSPSQLATGGQLVPNVMISDMVKCCVQTGALSEPTGLAFDHTGNLWVADQGIHIVEYARNQLTRSGTPTPRVEITSRTPKVAAPSLRHTPVISGTLTTSGTSFCGNACNGPIRTGLALDSAGDLWLSDITLMEFTPRQIAKSGSPTPAVTITTSEYGAFSGEPAFDPAGDLWAANLGQATVMEYTPDELAASGAPSPAATIGGDLTELYAPGSLAVSG
jgi:sugar lactone lactonase YvrE